MKVGPFDVNTEIKGENIEVSAGIGWHGLKQEFNTILCADHTNAAFGTGSIANYSASVSADYDDTAGDVTLTAKACHPQDGVPFGEKTCYQSSASIHVLPKSGLCTMAAGMTEEGVAWLSQNHPDSLSCSKIETVLRELTPERIDALKNIGDLTRFPIRRCLTHLFIISKRQIYPRVSFIGCHVLVQKYWKIFLANCSATQESMLLYLGLQRSLTLP